MNVNVKIKFITALLVMTALGAVFANAATTQRPVDKTPVPDFAFPDKVAADADARLGRALESGDGAEVVNSLVCYSLARNAVSPSLLPPVLQRIDSVAGIESEPGTKSLLYLLEARIYDGLYRRDKWRYDRRVIPADTLAADYTEWSGEQFRGQIDALLSRALEPQEALLASPLKDWSRIIDSNEYTYIFYPTLYDLVAYNAISIYESMAESDEVLPFRFVFPELILRPIPLMARVDGYSRRAHELCIELARIHAGNPAPEITARLRAVDCMESLVVDNDSYDVDDTYMAIYREFANSEFADEALIACAPSSSGEYLDLVRAALDRFPDYFRADALRQRVFQAERPSLSYHIFGNVTPGKPFKVSVRLSNAAAGSLMFYRDPDGMASDLKSNRITDAMRAAATKYAVAASPRPKPYTADTTVTITLSAPGRYFVWAEIEGVPEQKDRFDTLLCTDIAPVSFGFDGNVYPYAVNSFTGRPMQGVQVSGMTYGNRKYSGLGVTGPDGTLAKPVSAYSRLMLGKDGQSISFNPPWTYQKQPDTRWHTQVSVFTSLPLYHHGDSVEWAIVAYRSLDGRHELMTDKEFLVKIFDANDEPVDSVMVTTDASGRAEGVTKLPDDGLSGRYNVSIFDGKTSCGWGGFMVNDYKLPTFTVAVTDVRRSANPDSAVVITCKAETYSLMPLGGAKVAVELSEMPRYWWGSAERPFWSTDTVTRADGTLQLVLPRELLDLSPKGYGYYQVTFNVTSAGGETRSCSRIFNTGKPYTILMGNENDAELKSPVDLGVTVIDAKGEKVSLPLKYTIMDDSVKVAEFTGEIDPDRIKPDMYDIIVAPVDTTLADAVTMENITLYRAKGDCPLPMALYVPVTEYKATADDVEILLGSGVDNSYVLATVIVDAEMVKREWFELAKGMHTYRVDVPAACERVQVLFNSVNDNNLLKSTVNIDNQRSVKELAVEMESFRDKVVPNTPESITLKVRMNGNPVQSSVLMLMESQAILQLQPHYLVLNTGNRAYPYLSSGYYSRSLSGGLTAAGKSYEWPSITRPALDLYGYSFVSSYNNKLMIRGRRMMSATDDLNTVREHADEVVVEESAAPMAMAYGASKADGGAKEVIYAQDEDALQEVVVTKKALTGSAAAAVGSADTFSYRPSEIPLAFFAPMLSTGADGSLTYTYTVPDANTSWSLKALAYTPDMLTASLQRTVTSSRPVMVQATLPRFLRYGDSTSFRATVMNATDSLQIVTTTVSVLDAAGADVLASLQSVDSIAPRGSVVVSIPFKAPADGQALIYRVKSQAGNYTDGEQSLLPLLPVSQPVIFTESFYMSPNSTSMTIELPSRGSESTSTLYLYDNPLWEVVTALPSLRGDESTSSIGAMCDIYMAAVARGIMNANPELKRALKEWLESDRSDETLTSMLSRNDGLKQLALDATPWVRDAMSDADRLSSLALMLDDSNITSTINRGIKTLRGLAMPDGGIAWCPGYQRSSTWATYRVLVQAASLQERGYMPRSSDLDRIIAGAVDYIDNETARSLKLDNGKGDYTQYAYIRSILRGTKPSPTAKTAIARTIQNILKRWPGEAPADKATDAVILYHNGYPTMARKLVASIKAYSMSSPRQGTWWEGLGVNVTANLLYAIETVTPADKELIGSVAQWLILSKTNQSWNGCAATSATIDALLGAIDVKQAVAGRADVTLNGRPVVSDTPQMPGMTVADISASLTGAPAILSIAKSTGLQAMGSVITRSIMVMDSISATSHPSVSIAKRYNVVKGTSVVGADTLSVGDRVKIQLVIKVTDDLDYVTIVDRRAACLEPVQQLSGYASCDGIWFYREVTDSETRLFIERLPRGTYVIDTDMNVVSQGCFTSGVATLQSQINPGVAANSAAGRLTVTR